MVAVPTLLATSRITTATSVGVSQTTTTTYNKGELIVSHDGAIVATAALDSTLGQNAATSLTISGLPSGSTGATLDSALYYVSVRVWNSGSPATTLNRVTYPNALDLRTGAVPSYSIQIP
jgi:hypothetical protein